jgi:putative transposase
MARKPRIHYPGALYHVILRGYEGDMVCRDARDRQHLYALIEDGVGRFRHRVHAFCLLPGTIHLLLQVEDIPLSRIMQNLSFRYTRWVNDRRGREGHLFHGRYKALIVDPGDYLLDLVRYLHLLPIQEKLARQPEKYRWSSHRAYLDLEEIPWLTTDWVLSQFSPKGGWARKKYESFIAAGKGEGERKDFLRGTSQGRFLGDTRFAHQAVRRAAKVSRSRLTLDGVISRVCRMYGMRESQLVAPGKVRAPAEARGVVALIVREAPHLSLTELSERFGRDLTTLSTAASRLVARVKTDQGLAERLAKLNVRY